MEAKIAVCSPEARPFILQRPLFVQWKGQFVWFISENQIRTSHTQPFHDGDRISKQVPSTRHSFFLILSQSFPSYNSISIYFKRIWWIIDIFICRATYQQCVILGAVGIYGDGDGCLLLLLLFLPLYYLFMISGIVLHSEFGTFCTAHRNSIMMPLGKHQYALDTRYLMNCRNIYKLFVRLSDVFAELEDRFCLGYSIHIFLENYLRIWIKETHWNFSIILSQVNAEYSLSISFLRVNLWHRKSVCEFSTPNQTNACLGFVQCYFVMNVANHQWEC